MPEMPKRISAEVLKSWMDSGSPRSLKIVDVRDSDYFGGHVRSSINAPSQKFNQSLSSLKQQVQEAEKVVFYCQLSQQRGPTCAELFSRNSDQDIYILDGGFQGWAYTFGKDPKVTEGFIADIYP